MKTLLIAIMTIVALTHLVNASPSDGKQPPQPKTPEKLIPPNTVLKENFTINFYNEGDRPPTPPFMSIVFSAVPNTSVKQIQDWREEIDQKIKKMGGMSSKEDYEKKITPLLLEYIKRFTGTGATTIRIDFPRIRQGVFLYR